MSAHSIAFAEAPGAQAPGAGLHALFEQVVRRQPDAPALVADGERLSYRQLDERADRLAATLRDEAGIAPGAIVALRSEPDLPACVAILAILKAGAAYLPLDPEDAPARTLEILRQASPVLLVDNAPGRLDPAAAGVPSRTLAELEAARGRVRPDPVACSSAALAYVPFTSGSTGRPKGVLNSHRACAAHALSLAERWPLEPGGRWCLKASLTFVDSIYELFGGLLEEGTVVVAGGERRKDPERLLDVLARHAVTRVLLVPALLDAMLDVARPGQFAGLAVRTWLVGGDRFPPPLARRLRDSGATGRLLNIYGCSEAPGTACELHDDPPEPVAVGVPLSGMTATVRDDRLHEVRDGDIGEVCLGGAGVADGYLGSAAASALAFRPDPLSPGRRMYCTGDLGVRRRDGSLAMLGRRDDQVKVRGHRVEVREVERVLDEHPGVRESVVVQARGVPAGALVAWCRSEPGGPAASPRELHALARERLPVYMRPARLRVVDELPVSPNGKVDRRRLAEAEAVRREAGGDPPAAGGLEAPIVRAWSDLLGVAVAPGDDVFELGADSLLAARVVARLRQRAGMELSVADVFEAPTAQALAARVRPATARPRLTPDRAGAGAPAPLSYPQRSFWFLDQLEGPDPAHTIVRAFRLGGGLDPAALREASEALVRRHAALRTRFELGADGPVQVPLDTPPASLWWEGRDLEAFARAPFELAAGEVIRFLLDRGEDGGHLFAVALHHICTDDRSLELMFDELSRLYGAVVNGLPIAEAPPEPSYRAFARWQHALVDEGALDRQLVHWRSRLAGLPASELVPENADGATNPKPAQEVSVHIAEDAALALEAAAHAAGSSVQMVLLSAYAGVLARRSGQGTVCIGVPVNGRTAAELDEVIGCFANVIAFRADVEPGEPFGCLLERVRETFLADLANSEIPFEKVAESAAAGQRPVGIRPLFEAMFGYQARPDSVLALEGVRVEPVDAPVLALPTQLDLAAVRMADGLFIVLRGNAHAFGERDLARMLQELCDAATGPLEAPLADRVATA